MNKESCENSENQTVTDIGNGDKPEITQKAIFHRRQFLKLGGATLAGASFIGGPISHLPFGLSLSSASAQDSTNLPSTSLSAFKSPIENRSSIMGLVDIGRGKKPVYVPPQNSTSPAAYATSENIFWTDIMMEHSLFFALLMPGNDLIAQRNQAMRFQAIFAHHLKLLKTVGVQKIHYKALCKKSGELLKPLIEYKHKMKEMQETGKMHSLVWPLFFHHTIHEAEHFMRKMELLAKDQFAMDQKSVVSFWPDIMSEHSLFIAHLLDPSERKLVEKAYQTSSSFQGLLDSPNIQQHINSAEEIIDFKLAAEKGIDTGEVQSIINPALVDHVLREAVKYRDELSRIS